MNLYGNHGKIKICNMKVNVCFYTDENFRIRENILIDDLKSKGFDKIYNYRAEDVKQGDFYLENKELLDLEKGDGYWVWKPKIILDTFNNMEFGDVLLYIDAGDKLNGEIVNSMKDFFKTEDYYYLKEQINIGKDSYSKITIIKNDKIIGYKFCNNDKILLEVEIIEFQNIKGLYLPQKIKINWIEESIKQEWTLGKIEINSNYNEWEMPNYKNKINLIDY